MNAINGRIHLVILTSIILITLFAGCTKSNGTPPPAPPVTNAKPTATILSPADQTIAAAGDITITVAVTDFSIIKKIGLARVEEVKNGKTGGSYY